MKSKIKLSSDQRSFSMIYDDFLESNLFDWNEKRIFIVLKKFANNDGQCFPSVQTLCKFSQLSKNTVLKTLKTLEEKKAISVERRKNKNGKTISNLYTLYDYQEIWNADSIEQIIETVDIEELRLFELAKKKGYRLEKEKEPGTTAPSKETVEPSTKFNQSDIVDTTTNSEKSQEPEKYTLDQIQQLFDYDIMLKDHPDQQQDIDSVMNVLHTAMNTSRTTIRISGTDKPAMAVIGKLMKLDKESIMYAIDKFSEQTERIKNPTAYILTILYNAPEQYHLDIKNQISNEMTKENCSQEEKKKDSKSKDSKNGFANFEQRTYDYEILEKELLNQ